MISLHSATLIKAKVAIMIRQSQMWVLGLGNANVAPHKAGASEACLYYIKENVDEIAPSLASEIAKLHNSSQLRSYRNYYNC